MVSGQQFGCLLISTKRSLISVFPLQQGSYTPTNSELLEYWVSKRAPDRLLACEHAVVDYELEGSKVKTNLLFEAATTAGNVRD